MSKNLFNVLQADPALQSLVDHILSSPRMRAAAGELSRRVSMLDALDRAGFPITNAMVQVRFQGRQVTTVFNPQEDVSIGGGGIGRFDPDAPRGGRID